jgi:hypothetical protein
MLGAEILGAQPPRFLVGEIDHPLPRWRELGFPSRHLGRLSSITWRVFRLLEDFAANAFERNPEAIHQQPGRDTLAVASEPQEKVLAADAARSKTRSFFLCCVDRVQRPLGELAPEPVPLDLPRQPHQLGGVLFAKEPRYAAEEISGDGEVGRITLWWLMVRITGMKCRAAG